MSKIRFCDACGEKIEEPHGTINSMLGALQVVVGDFRKTVAEVVVRKTNDTLVNGGLDLCNSCLGKARFLAWQK